METAIKDDETEAVINGLKKVGFCEVIGKDSVLFLKPGLRVVVRINPGERFEVKDIENCTSTVIHGLEKLKSELKTL